MVKIVIKTLLISLLVLAGGLRSAFPVTIITLDGDDIIKSSVWTPTNLGVLVTALGSSDISVGDVTADNIFIRDTNQSNTINLKWNENDTINRVLNLAVSGADRTVTLAGNLIVPSSATVSGTNTGDQTITLTGAVTGTGTGSFVTTLSADQARANLTGGSGILNLSGFTLTPITPAQGGTGLDTSATVADRFLYTSGTGTWAAGIVTSTGRSILDDASPAAVRTTLQLNTPNGWATADRLVTADETSGLIYTDIGAAAQMTIGPITSVDDASVRLNKKGNGWISFNRTLDSGYVHSLNLQGYDSASVLGGVLSSYAAAIGWDNMAAASNSVAIGYNNSTAGNASTALGAFNSATGPYSTVLGSFSLAAEQFATSIGYHNVAGGLGSSVIGWGSITSGRDSIAFGRDAMTGGAFVGKGTGSVITRQGTQDLRSYFAIGDSISLSGYQAEFAENEIDPADRFEPDDSVAANEYGTYSVFTAAITAITSSTITLDTPLTFPWMDAGRFWVTNKTRGAQQISWGASKFTNPGDAQDIKVILKGFTEDATPFVLNTNTSAGSPVSAASRIYVPRDHTMAGTVKVAARKTTGVSNFYTRSFIAKNVAGATSIEGDILSGPEIENDIDWSIDITANDTYDSIEITVTGESGSSIRWVATLEMVEIGYEP